MTMYCKMIFLTLLASGIAGCVMQYPMGLTRQQWDGLSPAQQADFQAKQYAINEQRRQQEEAQQREQLRLEAEQARIQHELIQQRYSAARYGDIVHVVITGGHLRYAGKQYPYEPVSFDLVKGEIKRVKFYGRGMNTIATEYTVRLAEDGNTIYFDDSFRKRVVLVNENWDSGQSYRPNGTENDVGVGLADMTFHVRLKEISGAPQRIIIDHR